MTCGCRVSYMAYIVYMHTKLYRGFSGAVRASASGGQQDQHRPGCILQGLKVDPSSMSANLIQKHDGMGRQVWAE